MCPGQSIVYLFVILIGPFAGDEIASLKSLPCVLPAAENSVLAGSIPIKPGRVVTSGKIKAIWCLKYSRAARAVGYGVCKPVDNRLHKRPVGRRVKPKGRIRMFKPVCRIPFANQE